MIRPVEVLLSRHASLCLLGLLQIFNLVSSLLRSPLADTAPSPEVRRLTTLLLILRTGRLVPPTPGLLSHVKHNYFGSGVAGMGAAAVLSVRWWRSVTAGGGSRAAVQDEGMWERCKPQDQQDQHYAVHDGKWGTFSKSFIIDLNLPKPVNV